MAHSTKSSEEIAARNLEILAYFAEHPKASNTAVGVKYNLSRETIRGVRSKAALQEKRNAYIRARNERLQAKFGKITRVEKTERSSDQRD